jgi:putative ABC transport system substrate-binding protein
MKNIFKICILLSLIIKSAFASDTLETKIAVVVPMEHRAMNDIIRGVKDSLDEAIDKEKIVIFNGMGDINNVSAIMNQVAQNPDYRAVMPIGTNLTYIALSAIHNKDIIGLGSIIDEEMRQELIKNPNTNMTNVYDELKAQDILQFLSGINKKNILIIFSNDEKITRQLEEIEKIHDKFNLKIHKFNVSNTGDIFGLSSALSNIDCILTLKDHTVVSIMNVIAKIAHEHNIVVVASDEGSTISGADIGIGIDEYDIGVTGGDIIKHILRGDKARSIPVKTLTNIKVFVNPKAKIDIKGLQKLSSNLGYKVEEIEIEVK